METEKLEITQVKPISLRLSGYGRKVVIIYNAKGRAQNEEYVVTGDGGSTMICINDICSDELPEISKLLPSTLKDIVRSRLMELFVTIRIYGLTDSGKFYIETERISEDGRPKEVQVTGVLVRDARDIVFRLRIIRQKDGAEIIKSVADTQLFELAVNHPVVRHVITTALMAMIKP